MGEERTSHRYCAVARPLWYVSEEAVGCVTCTYIVARRLIFWIHEMPATNPYSTTFDVSIPLKQLRHVSNIQPYIISFHCM